MVDNFAANAKRCSRCNSRPPYPGTFVDGKPACRPCRTLVAKKRHRTIPGIQRPAHVRLAGFAAVRSLAGQLDLFGEGQR